MTPTEMALILGNILQGLWQLIQRSDRRSALSTAKAELEKDVERLTTEIEKMIRTHDATMAAKNTEIGEWRRHSERLEDRAERLDARITELQDRLYSGRGGS
jgi:chromosome segregation ATPase